MVNCSDGFARELSFLLIFFMALGKTVKMGTFVSMFPLPLQLL